MPANVIQGNFPHGLPRFSRSEPNSAVQPKTNRPQWVNNAISFSGPRVQQKAAPVQRHAAPPRADVVQLPPHVLRAPATAGRRLEPEVRQMMESIFGASFSDVRVHVGPHVAALGAVAYTQGSDVHFAPGQYDPHTAHGRQILAHELTHVVQQRAGRVRNPFSGGVAVVQEHGLEAEASRMELRARMQQPQSRAIQPLSRTAHSAARAVVQRSSEFTFGGKGGPGKGGDPPDHLGRALKGADDAAIRKFCNNDEIMTELLAAMYAYSSARTIRADVDENGARVLDIALLRNSPFRPVIEYLSRSLVRAGGRGAHGNGEGIYPAGVYSEYGILGGGMRLVVNTEDTSAYVSVHYARGTVYRLGGAGIDALMSRLINNSA
jgi:hypothetical protein